MNIYWYDARYFMLVCPSNHAFIIFVYSLFNRSTKNKEQFRIVKHNKIKWIILDATHTHVNINLSPTVMSLVRSIHPHLHLLPSTILPHTHFHLPITLIPVASLPTPPYPICYANRTPSILLSLTPYLTPTHYYTTPASSHQPIFVILLLVITYIFSLHLSHIYSHLTPPHPTPPVPHPTPPSSHPSLFSFLVEWAYTIVVVKSLPTSSPFTCHTSTPTDPPSLLPLSPYPPIQLPQFPPILVILLSWVSIHYCGSKVITYIFSLHLPHIYPHCPPPILLPYPPIPHLTPPVPTHPRYPS